jgi:hypothetical protein
MIILAFGKAAVALRAGRKTVTRCEWTDHYHEQVRQQLNEALAKGDRGLRAQAWNATPPRCIKRVGAVLITSLTREKMSDIPETDWEAEGFAYMEEHGIDAGEDVTWAMRWAAWLQNPNKVMSVVRFEVEEIYPEDKLG